MRATLALALLTLAVPARAADMAIVSFDGPNPIISVSGRIEIGDDHRFDEFAQALKVPAVVRLESIGGNTMAALAIGREISRLGFTTYVPPDGMCASACGLIWLAGKPRMSASTSKIGLHASYLKQGDVTVENSPGNALVGKYLGELGFSDEFTMYATSAAPQDMSWLNRSVTDAFGVAWIQRDDSVATLVTVGLPPAPAAAVPPPPAAPATIQPAAQPIPLAGASKPTYDFIPPVPGYPVDQRPGEAQKPLPKPPEPPKRVEVRLKPKPVPYSQSTAQPGLIDALGDLVWGHHTAP